jgi:plastocyanin domain-containing protein
MFNSNLANTPNTSISKKRISRNYTIAILILISLIILGFFAIPKITGKLSNPDSEIKKITLSFKDYNYYPNIIKVKKGVPVEITLDNSITGCFREFTIQELGILKYSSSPEDKINFTPNKSGTFRYACSMGMGYGKIIVEP